MDFPVTVESQEAFDELVKARLERETRKQSDLQQQVDQLKQQNGDLTKSTEGHEAALEAAKQEAVDAAKEELTKVFHDKLRAAEVRAQAAHLRFNDPGDAIAALGDLSGIEVGDDFTIDAGVIKTQLGEVMEKKPYLVATGEDYSFEENGGLGRKGNSDPLAGKSGVDLMASAFDAANSK